MRHLLNPVFRSIEPQNNNPKNLPVYGLNVLAFARIQTSSNGGFATRRKGRFAPLSAVACGPALTPLRSKPAAHGVSPNRRKFRVFWTDALSGIGNNRTESSVKAFGRNGTGNRLKGRLPAPFCSHPGVPALLRIGRKIDTSPSRIWSRSL